MTTNSSSASTPTLGELLEGLSYAVAGIGLGFISFLAAIPGLLPVVVLIVFPLAVLLIPLVLVGALLGLVVLSVRGVARAISSRARSPRRRRAREARTAAPPQPA